MAQYRKRPVVIEAWQWLGSGFESDAPKWVKEYRDSRGNWIAPTDSNLIIPTLEGDHTASPNDWIIQGIKGELYPCKPDIFEATYEPV